MKDIYRRYFQKSKIFLYPLLDIKRGTSVTPIQTYVSWKSYYSPYNMKLIAKYYVRNDEEFNAFQKNILLKHSRLSDYVLLDTQQAVYTFDFSDTEDDWNMFLNGKYSKINRMTKNLILNYYKGNPGNYAYIDSYLNPQKYFNIYADLLKVSEKSLRDVGELCELPDFDKENLTEDVKDLEKTNIVDYFIKN